MSAYSTGAINLIQHTGGGGFWDLGFNGATDMTQFGHNGVGGGSITLGNQTFVPFSGAQRSTYFDNIDDRVDYSGYNPYGNGRSTSFFGWYYRVAGGVSANMWGSPGSGATQPFITITGTNGLDIWPAGTGGTAAHARSGAASTWAGTWKFVTFVFDQVAGTSSLYVDGVFVDTKTGAWTYPSASLKIGCRATSTDSFNGYMHGTGIAEGKLSTADVAWLYSLAAADPPPTPPPSSSPPIPRRQEVSPLSVNFEFYDQRDPRGGSDERDVGVTLVDGEIDCELPGGFGPATLTFPRPSGWSIFDSARLAGCITSDDSGRTAHEGQVVGAPKTGSETIEVQLQGWIKTLEDNKSASVIFRDIDLTAWQQASVQLKAAYLGFTQSVTDPSVVPDPSTGVPCLQQEISGPWTNATRGRAHFDAGVGNYIRSMYYAWKISSTVNSADTNYVWQAVLRDDDIVGTADGSGNLRAAGPSGGTVTATSNTRRWAEVDFDYGASSANAGNQYDLLWTTLAVYGTDLPKHGSAEPNKGLYVSDMIPYVVGRWAPKLQVTPDSIEQTTFTVPHASFKDPGTALAIVQALALYGGSSNLPLDYGCWEDKTFFLKSPGNYGNEWLVRFDEGTDEDDQGDDSQELINGIIIQYNPGDGSVRKVGPNKSVADFGTDLLTVTDPEHPANKSGDTRWDIYDAGITSLNGAILIGQLVLGLKNSQSWRGSMSLQGMQHTAAATMPPYMVRPGDYLISQESTDTSPRRVVNTSYDIGTRTVKASVGAQPDVLDVLLARAGIVLQGRI